MTAPRPTAWAYGCLGLSMALVGSYVALSKPLLAVFPVFLLAGLRFAVGAVAMATWLRRPPTEAPLTGQTRWLLFLESFLGNFLFSICMLFGMRYSSAVAAGLIMSAIPAVVALLSWVFLRERMTWKTWAAIGCAAVGMVLFSLSKPELESQYSRAPGSFFSINLEWLGYALLLGAVLCEAAYAVIGKTLSGRMGARRISALINLWGLGLVLPLAVWAGWSFDFGAVAAPMWALLVFYGLAASVGTVWLWMTGLKTVPASRAGVFTVMLPISAALTGVLVLGESLTLLQGVAFGLALAGVVLATRPDAAAPAAAAASATNRRD